MAKTWALTEHITAHLSKKRLGDIRPPSLWPSDGSCDLTNKYGETYHVGSCRRATFFRYTVSSYFYTYDQNLLPLVTELISLEEQPDKYMRWIWEAGNLFEDFIIEQAKQSGVWVASQVQIVIPSYNVVGKLDLIVRSPLTGNLIAEEVKSIYGHNANSIIGTPGMKSRGLLGAPRDSNMIQLAIYDWHMKTRMSNLESSRLLYGARDTGRFAEFEITTPTDITQPIKYQGVSPYLTSPVESPITIAGILNNYEYVDTHFKSKEIPKRDYDLQYSDEKLETLYQRQELSKTNTEAYEKIKARKAENSELLACGKKAKKDLVPLKLGDWPCSNCTWRKVCYNEDSTPRNI